MILNESFSLVVQHFQSMNYSNIECHLNFLETMLKLFSYGVSSIHARCSSGDAKPIDNDIKKSLSNEIQLSDASKKSWTINSHHNTKNEVSNNSTCENEDSKNKVKTRLSNVEFSVMESSSKCIDHDNLLVGCPLFHCDSAMHHVET